jgi:hypothetical protein
MSQTALQDRVRAARPPLPPETLSLAQIRNALRSRLPGIGLSTEMALAPIDHLFDHARSTLRFSRASAS